MTINEEITIQMDVERGVLTEEQAQEIRDYRKIQEKVGVRTFNELIERACNGGADD